MTVRRQDSGEGANPFGGSVDGAGQVEAGNRLDGDRLDAVAIVDAAVVDDGNDRWSCRHRLELCTTQDLLADDGGTLLPLFGAVKGRRVIF